MNPDLMPDLAPILMAKLYAVAQEEGTLEMAHPDAKVRHSDAGSCSRKIYYKAAGEEATDPPDAVTHYTFRIGHMLHEEYQDALQQLCDAKGWEVEIEKQVYVPEARSAGHLDAHITKPDEKVTIEIKTINGTGYKNSVGAIGKNPGPRHSALVQGSINAYAAGADRLVIVYLPLEVVAKSTAQKKAMAPEMRAAAQWSYSKEEFTLIAEEELARFRWIVNAAERGEPVPRYIPDPSLPRKSVVVDPNSGTTEGNDGERSKTWQCGYCDFQTKCIQDFTGFDGGRG